MSGKQLTNLVNRLATAITPAADPTATNDQYDSEDNSPVTVLLARKQAGVASRPKTLIRIFLIGMGISIGF